MSLATRDDLLRPAVSDPDRNVYELVGDRVHGKPRVMPPGKMLAAPELATLDAWIAGGAAAATDANACKMQDSKDAGATATIGPDSLPCRPDAVFRARGDSADEGFHVPADAGNLYRCFAFKAPYADAREAIAFAPILDDTRVLHHVILFVTTEPQQEGTSYECGSAMPKNSTVVSGWAPGKMNTVMPADVGEVLPGQDHWYVLQLHYHNLVGFTDVHDRSGIAMCTTAKPREHAAAVTMLGTPLISIPPHADDYHTSGTCVPTNTEPVHVLSAGPHMHTHGTSITTVIDRGGDPSKRETLLDVANWDFESQVSQPVSMIVQRGDTLTTTCHYKNTTDQAIKFGERTEDEMCFDFLLSWPAGALADAPGARNGACIGFPIQ
jgi:hypothetical protein